MDIHNICTITSLSLSLDYIKHKKYYQNRNLRIESESLSEPGDEFGNNPFGIKVVVYNTKTKRGISKCIPKELLEYTEDVYSALKPIMQEMILNTSKEIE